MSNLSVGTVGRFYQVSIQDQLFNDTKGPLTRQSSGGGVQGGLHHRERWHCSEKQAGWILLMQPYNKFYVYSRHHPFSCQDSELKRTVDESERIKRAYGHYFDLCIINDGHEAAFRSLRSALEKLTTEQQWVPVSWVFWKELVRKVSGPQLRGVEDNLTCVAPEGGLHGNAAESEPSVMTSLESSLSYQR